MVRKVCFELLMMSQHTLELRILWSSMNMESRCDRSASYDLLGTGSMVTSVSQRKAAYLIT
jgi:hypothetical protein